LGSFGKCSKFSLNNGANAKHEKPLLKKWKNEQNLGWVCVIVRRIIYPTQLCVTLIPILLVVLYEPNECHLTWNHILWNDNVERRCTIVMKT
jgi:hypothetical protein